MAKYEKRLRGDFQAFLDYLVDGVLNGSASASFEDGSDWEASGVRCAVRVFERYSWTGGNRVSMNLTLPSSKLADALPPASFEDGSDWEASGVRCAVRVFERYSWTGGNRVSMNLTLVGSGDELFLSAITSGGSQAMFWKMNTIGEESFLDCVAGLAEHYAGR